ncbi:MAG: caspase family protein [Bacteroidales bacterium]
MKKFVSLSVFFFIIISSFSQNIEKRIALIIGNNTYNNAPLKNPVNDANLMASTLQGLGFTVIKKINANRTQMAQAITDFWSKLGNYNVALFFYAGHGVQVNGVNYLIPVDATMNTQDMVSFEAISVNEVVSKFEEYPQNTNIVILDACRNNPFRSWARSGARGFKAMNPGSGTIIAFATSEGATASDGEGSNGLFTEKLVKHLSKPIPIETVFKNTRVDVQKASGGNQSPQEWTKLTGEFYFTKKSASVISNEIENQQGNIYDNTEKSTMGLKFESEITGEVFIDSIKHGDVTDEKRTLTINNLAPGKHILEIRGSEPFRKNFVIIQNRFTNLMAKSRKGTILNEKLIDPRDGKQYKVVKIGGQVWMAENLAYQSTNGWVKSKNPDDLKKYGYWYNWETAQQVCPPGWKLPAKSDFQLLLDQLGGISNQAELFEVLNEGGLSQFSVRFAGYVIVDIISGLNTLACFWTESDDNVVVKNTAWYLNVYRPTETLNYKGAGLTAILKELFLSVRCLKNNRP